MINFDGVDFSERRSEEVMSFFWWSVYINSSDIYLKIAKNFLGMDTSQTTMFQ